jgi:hypothetical protein
MLKKPKRLSNSGTVTLMRSVQRIISWRALILAGVAATTDDRVVVGRDLLMEASND